MNGFWPLVPAQPKGKPKHSARAAHEPPRIGELKRLVDESPWLQFTSECQRF
jgi:hypothetical protein